MPTRFLWWSGQRCPLHSDWMITPPVSGTHTDSAAVDGSSFPRASKLIQLVNPPLPDIHTHTTQNRRRSSTTASARCTLFSESTFSTTSTSTTASSPRRVQLASRGKAGHAFIKARSRMAWGGRTRFLIELIELRWPPRTSCPIETSKWRHTASLWA